MHIGMLADIYKPYISGVTHHIALSKACLEKKGHAVFVFTFRQGNYRDSEPNIIRSRGIPLLGTGFSIALRYPAPVQKLLQSMDIAHVHHPFVSGRLALRYCRPRGIPIVFTNHTRYDLYNDSYLPGPLKAIGRVGLRMYLPRFYRAVDLVIVPSEGMRQVLHSLGAEVDVEVVPNGIDLRPFLNPSHIYPRASLGWDEKDIVYIYVGRLGPEKNLPFLLRAFDAAVRACDRLRLVLVGDGPQRASLEEFVRHFGLSAHVHFVGAQPYDQIPSFLAMADVFVTASISESQGLTLIEAMAAGLPALGIRSPGIADSIQDGYNGYLVAEANLGAFVAKILILAQDEQVRRQMGLHARQLAHAYDLEHTTTLLLKHYERLIERARSERGKSDS